MKANVHALFIVIAMILFLLAAGGLVPERLFQNLGLFFLTLAFLV